MESRKEIQDFINKLIEEEHGTPIGPNNVLADAELDSLGLVFFFTELDFKYQILKDVNSGEEYKKFNLKETTLSSLINTCKLSKQS